MSGFGWPVHVPLPVASVAPLARVPVTPGSTVFTGTAASSRAYFAASAARSFDMPALSSAASHSLKVAASPVKLPKPTLPSLSTMLAVFSSSEKPAIVSPFTLTA